MSDAQFADGFFYKDKNANAPEWIDGRIVIKVDEFGVWYMKWRQQNPEEAWLSFDLKTSRDGKKYAQINTYKKLGMTEKPEALRKPEEMPDNINPDDIPFN
jgi:hypothetical protein